MEYTGCAQLSYNAARADSSPAAIRLTTDKSSPDVAPGVATVGRVVYAGSCRDGFIARESTPTPPGGPCNGRA